MPSYFFTADEHYGHNNIITYCKRPFDNVEQMDETIIQRHNEVVRKEDIVIHNGDFTLLPKIKAQRYISRLSGQHIFLHGSHDHWLEKLWLDIWEKSIEEQHIVVCHYAMRVWPRSHHNSWQLYGHSHGMLEPLGKQWDIGVDNNNFYPLSFAQIKEIMSKRPDNPNLVTGRD
jgi:calcineurin-like phosphoesterase family protein